MKCEYCGKETKLYYIKSDCGYGDSSVIESNLTKVEALNLFNKQINGDFKTFESAYNYDHPVYEIREIGY